MAEANCSSSQYLVPTPNLIAPLKTQAATPLCDQTLSAFADGPQLPSNGGAQLNAEQQSYKMRVTPDFVKAKSNTGDFKGINEQGKILYNQ